MSCLSIDAEFWSTPGSKTQHIIKRTPAPFAAHFGRVGHSARHLGCQNSLAAALGGLDAFVLTAGIGENSAGLCAGIAAPMNWLGAALDPDANLAGSMVISAPQSRVKVLVVPTNEELMIARHTVRLLVRS